MAKLKTIRPLQHEALATSIFELLSDQKKFTAMMKEFKDSRESLNGLIGKYATVKDIERAESDAKNALASAEHKASEIISAAEMEVIKDRKLVSDAQSKVSSREADCDTRDGKYKKLIGDGAKKIKSETARLDARESELEKREEAVATVAGEAGTLRAEYLERVNKMRSAMGDKPLDEKEAPVLPVFP